MMRLPSLATFLVLAACAACGGQYLESPLLEPGVKIRSSPEGEAVAAVIEDYGNALDSMDIEAIRNLVSQDYYENAGTTDTTTDDYGFDEVDNMFTMLLDHVEDIDVSISMRDVIVDGDDADVLFEYTMRVRYSIAESAHWETERDVNRVQLRNEEGNWRIVSGL